MMLHFVMVLGVLQPASAIRLLVPDDMSSVLLPTGAFQELLESNLALPWPGWGLVPPEDHKLPRAGLSAVHREALYDMETLFRGAQIPAIWQPLLLAAGFTLWGSAMAMLVHEGVLPGSARRADEP